jgi:acetylornithine deacetylase/succinyl-diaminopimelate desuccinylase-like protein
MSRHFPLAVLIGVLLIAAGQAQTASPAETETLQFLQQLVRLDTSNPPGNEIQAAQYIKSVFDKEGISSEIIEAAPGRANLIARLKGNGSKKPILLMAHLDVVRVDRLQWTVDPFAATIRDGYLYGRGSADDKSMVAGNMEVLLQLKREGVKLDRDVIFLSEAGEEGTPQFGISYLVKNHWDKIACEFALNEGGTTLVENGRVAYIAVGTTEKNPRVVRLIARGSSGHGSVPRPDNPVAHLGRAVGKLLDWQPPIKLNETTQVFFANIDKISDDPRLKQAADHLTSRESQQFLATRYPEYYSMLRTSVVPTILRGGFQRNVIPAEAEATLDVRAVPDENIDELLQQLRKVIGDPAIEVVADPIYRQISPPSKLDTEMYKALVAAQQKLYPQAFTIPQMGTGATDSSELRAKGVQAYGVHSPQTTADKATVHGNDERVSIAGVNEFVRYLRIAVEQVAAASPR